MHNEANRQNRNIVVEKSFAFALTIIELYKQLQMQKEFVLSKQLLRSGTSIGTNIEEAQTAQSNKDFISKMNIALKEASETKYWLRLLDLSSINKISLGSYINETQELIKLLTSIINSAKKLTVK